MNCTICGTKGIEKTYNKLSMFECSECQLVWRTDFDVSLGHYEEKIVDTGSYKEKIRLEDAYARMNDIRNYVDLNSVCDIGCGEGIFLKALLDKGYEKGVGLEPSDQISEYARRHVLTIHKGIISDVPLIQECANSRTMTMFHVIEHLDDPKGALTILYETMAPGSTLVIETPNFDSYTLRRVDHNHDLIYPEHFFYFNQKNLRQLLEGIGFNFVADGKRDFNPKNISIKESLFRLGLASAPEQKDRQNVSVLVEDEQQKSIESSENFIRKIVRRFLASLVKLFGRQNYMWIVVRK